MNTKKKINSLKNNKKIRVFLLFLVFSSLFWLFSTLSETYSYLANFKLNYTNLPENMVYQQSPIKEIYAQIETTGFTILGHKLHKKELRISIADFKKGKNSSYFYLPDKHITSLQKQLNDSKITKFIQDTIALQLGKLTSKKVPIVPHLNLVFKPGYKLTDQLVLNPDSIQITGAESSIDSIKDIQTLPIDIIDIDHDFTKEIQLDIQNKRLKIAHEKIRISGKVAKFTEGSIEIPIQISNVPKGVQMEIFPKTCLINYEVTFDNFSKVNAHSFIVSCKYSKEYSNQHNSLPIQVIKKPDFITAYSLQTKEVSYFIKK